MFVTGESIPVCPDGAPSKWSGVINEIAAPEDKQQDSIENKSDFYLGNNIPNPFSKKTKIPYYVPVNNASASIVIYNIMSNMIKRYPLSVGAGFADVSIENLNNGVYFYKLIINDEIKQTKKMVVIKE